MCRFFILRNFDFVDTIFHASNGAEFLSIIDKYRPELALMDINMPVMDGISVTRKAKSKFVDIKIVALSMVENINYYKKMVEAGADGFILKDTDSAELNLALSRILFDDEKYFSQKLLQKIYIDKNNDSLNNQIFSRREIEILQNLCSGLSAREIGERLFISHRTVERHRENLLKKTGTKNTISLVIYAIQHNIVDIENI